LRGPSESSETFNIEHHEKVMSVNYFGVLSFVEFWQKSCQDDGGAKFIVTSSVNALFAPPGGSAYCASKAAVSKAFESLSLTYAKTNLRFSIIYAGPVKTKGLVGKLPFGWNAEKMANYMVAFASTNKKSGYPSKFYGLLCMFLKNLPQRIVLKILGIS
jgi:3-hydroxy acid dehydrogenase/malonic semialdehyde reductase